jgi:hypothetical protein
VLLYCSAGGPQPPVAKGTTVQALDGTLSFLYNGDVRAICGHGFSAESAAVACFELYGSNGVISYATGAQQCESSDFWLDYVICTGSESDLDDCPHEPYGDNNCDPTTDCIQLYCQAGGPQPPVVVPDAVIIHSATDALLYVTYDDEERGLCDDGFTQYDAQVACEQLYGAPNVLSFATGQDCATTNYWLSEVNCTGSESSLLQCQHQALGQHNCPLSNQCVQLYCSAGGPQPPAVSTTPSGTTTTPTTTTPTTNDTTTTTTPTTTSTNATSTTTPTTAQVCIQIYTGCGYTGDSREICSDADISDIDNW